MTIRKRMPLILLTVVLLVFAQIIPVSAAAPKKESVEYKGNGKVEVEFRTKVNYRNTKVTVKDSSGTRYSTYIVDKDSDDLEFRIKNFKKGKTYRFTIDGIRKRGTVRYSSVSGTVKIPKATADIGKSKAYSIAVSDAASKYGADANTAELLSSRLDRDDGRKVYEIDFKASVNGTVMEFEYEIDASSGRILDRDCEVYDPYDR
ncbi:MAG: PepSY domain-containing protein [Anaerovoracaceae bacterium]